MHDDEMTERERWADDHGYVRIHCKIHGSTWSDSGGCDYCQDVRLMQQEEENYED